MSDQKHTFHAGAAIAAITPTFSKTVGNTPFKVNVTDLPDAALAYLAEYGFNQSLGDTSALSTLEKAKQAEKAGVLPEGFTKELTTANAATTLKSAIANGITTQAAFDAWEASYVSARAQARFDAIVSGDVEFGSSERLSPEERDRRDYTLSLLKTALASKGMKMPKDTDVLKAMLAKVGEAKSADIEKEVARRAKGRAAASDVDLSDFV